VKIGANARIIAEKVDRLHDIWGADRFNIVAHSKGGLDSRHYLVHEEGDAYINKLIQIGTPNGGTGGEAAIRELGAYLTILVGIFNPVGGLVVAASFAIAADPVADVGIELKSGEGAIQLQPEEMARYNATLGFPPKRTQVYAIAGDWEFSGFWHNFLDLLLRWVHGGRNDVLVPVWSVYALPWINALPRVISAEPNFSARHDGIYLWIEPVFERILPLVLTHARPERAPRATCAASIAPTLAYGAGFCDGDCGCSSEDLYPCNLVTCAGACADRRCLKACTVGNFSVVNYGVVWECPWAEWACGCLTAEAWTEMSFASTASRETPVSGELQERGEPVPVEPLNAPHSPILLEKVLDGEVKTFDIIVEPTNVVVFELLHKKGVLELELMSPSGSVLTETSILPDQLLVNGTGSAKVKQFIVRNPNPGTWRMSVIGQDVPSPAGEPFLAFASFGDSESGLEISAALDKEAYVVGESIKLQATVHEFGWPIQGGAAVMCCFSRKWSFPPCGVV